MYVYFLIPVTRQSLVLAAEIRGLPALQILSISG